MHDTYVVYTSMHTLYCIDIRYATISMYIHTLYILGSKEVRWGKGKKSVEPLILFIQMVLEQGIAYMYVLFRSEPVCFVWNSAVMVS